jgi:hypothetical protein
MQPPPKARGRAIAEVQAYCKQDCALLHPIMPAVTFIDALPRFVTLEEHDELTKTTPASFADIPPVLRHKEADASARFDPALPGFESENDRAGTLYVVERCVVTPFFCCICRTRASTVTRPLIACLFFSRRAGRRSACRTHPSRYMQSRAQNRAPTSTASSTSRRWRTRRRRARAKARRLRACAS